MLAPPLANWDTTTGSGLASGRETHIGNKMQILGSALVKLHIVNPQKMHAKMENVPRCVPSREGLEVPGDELNQPSAEAIVDDTRSAAAFTGSVARCA
jgi:hypothetical protein